MRKLKGHKLTLGLETVRELSQTKLSGVVGGGLPSWNQQVCSVDSQTRYTVYANCTADSYAITACTGC